MHRLAGLLKKWIRPRTILGLVAEATAAARSLEHAPALAAPSQ
jgi:hypothetical protein